LDRASIFDKGDLLIEAKTLCCDDRAAFLNWLFDEFEWSEDTAERYIKVVQLGEKFRNLRNLKLGKTTLYQLADEAGMGTLSQLRHEDELAAIIDELGKHATKKQLRPRDAQRVIDVGIGRHRYGDHPDATLAALVAITDGESVESQRKKVVAELLRREPETEEAANAIIDDVDYQDDDDDDEGGNDDADDEDGNAAAEVTGGEDAQGRAAHSSEAEKTLESPPPDMPPPAPARTPSVALTKFNIDVHNFKPLVTKHAAKFAHAHP
jgi:hypothetical protein